MDNGWPFLIARGRRRGYEVLLAPDFLVAAQEYGFLEEVAGPSRHGTAPRIAAVTTPGGRPACLVWTEYLVRGNDLAPGAADPVDEHGRPLLLVLGFLCANSTVTQPAAADLAHAHRAALATYRSFLADEEGFAVRESSPFELASALNGPDRISPDRATPGLVSRGTGTAAALAVVAIALVAGVVLLGVTLFRPAAQPPPAPVPLTCTSTVPTARPCAAPTTGRSRSSHPVRPPIRSGRLSVAGATMGL